MARLLYVYVNHRPNTELDPVRREFLRYILSQQGQAGVIKDGYYPITARIAEDALKKVGIAMTSTAEASAPR
jgi:phosphate transport system substrate-binding protein